MGRLVAVIETFPSGSENEVPSAALLERVLAHAAQVEIIEAPPDDIDRADVVRTLVSGPEIAELARLLAVVDGGTGEHCRCLGWPTSLVRDADGHQVARWTLHHQTGIRVLGSCDAELRDAPALTEWLAEHGLTRSREIQHMLGRQRHEAEQRRTAWVAAAPSALAAAAESASHREDEAETRLADLVAQRYPDPFERIRTLLAWVGRLVTVLSHRIDTRLQRVCRYPFTAGVEAGLSRRGPIADACRGAYAEPDRRVTEAACQGGIDAHSACGVHGWTYDIRGRADADVKRDSECGERRLRQ